VRAVPFKIQNVLYRVPFPLCELSQCFECNFRDWQPVSHGISNNHVLYSVKVLFVLRRIDLFATLFIFSMYKLIFMYWLLKRMWNVCVVSQLLHCCGTDANWMLCNVYPTCKDIALVWSCLFFVCSAECVVLFLVASDVCLSVFKDEDRITQLLVSICSYICYYKFRLNWTAVFRNLHYRLEKMRIRKWRLLLKKVSMLL